MKRITLSIMLITAIGAVGAQVPPTPPATPVRPAPAEPVVTPAPRAPVARDPYFYLDRLDVEEIRRRAAEAARMARDIDHDAVRATAEAVRAQSAHIAEMAREQSRHAAELAREHSRIDSERLREEVRRSTELAREYAYQRPTPMPSLAPLAPLPPMPVMAPMSPMAPMPHFADDFRVPRPYFVQGEPSDSLYRLAHELLNRQEYGRAAQMFKDIAQKYPNTIYQNDLPYYEAFARYRIGTTPELEIAAKLLEPRASKLVGQVQQSGNPSGNYSNSGRQYRSDADVTALYVRINSALASRGNNNAAAIVNRAAQSGAGTCDREEISIKVEAMGALSQMDPATALPIVRTVLGKKDDCTVELRKRAIFILGRRGDTDAASLLATTAKSDPSTDVRVEAIGWLPRVQGDAGVNMLEELLRTEQEERIQRAAVRTLTSSDNQRARSSMRALIDRKDAPINLRLEAVGAFNSERATADDAAYLRGLYGRADNDRLKNAIINAVARIGGPENDQWVLNLAKNPSEPSQFRSTALSRIQQSNIAIADVMKLYEASDSYDMRSRIVNILSNRKETEAADKLVEIYRTSTVPSVKIQAMQALERRKDPRSAQLLNELFGKP